MIPTLSLPNIQQPPPVEVSVFTGQNADAALGRLPIITVPPPVNSPKVTDDGRGGQQQRHSPQQTLIQPSVASILAPLTSASGGIAFASPYSTPFVAQLFGQFTNSELPAGELDFDQLSQFSVVKYMPSLAARPRPESPRQLTQDNPIPDAVSRVRFLRPQTSAISAQDVTESAFDLHTAPVVSGDTPLPHSVIEYSKPSVSFFVQGPDAYGSTQARNEVNLAASAIVPEQPVNMVL